ncbi:MAG: hypothetical protein ACUVQ9_10355 [Thermodesulfobacteriota bacterium]
MKQITSCLATGIGSFPHKDEETVFRLILENFPEIPFLPQFPNCSFLENMMVQYSEGFPSLKLNEKEQRVWIDRSEKFGEEIERFYQKVENGDLESFQISEQFSRGLRLLGYLSLNEYRKSMKFIKGQIIGPVTFGLSLTDEGRKSIFYDDTLRDILIKHIALKAKWLEKRFNELLPGVETIIFFDEPALSSFGSAFSGLSREDVTNSLNKCFQFLKGLKGIHCCGNTDWSVLLSMDLDILSFDGYGYFENLSLYPRELENFLAGGGILAWGIVPTSEEVEKEDEESLIKRFNDFIHVLIKEGIDPMLLKRAIITPSCGTASLSIPLAERIYKLTSEIARRLREKGELEFSVMV